MSFFFFKENQGLEPTEMQMSGGHLLVAGLDGGNSVIFAEGENVIKSRLAHQNKGHPKGCPLFFYHARSTKIDIEIY